MTITPATFAAALVSGAHLDLADGNYGLVSMGRLKDVTIRGGKGAVLSGWNVSSCEDITFEGVTVDFFPGDGQTTSANAARFYNSKRVKALGVTLKGRPVAVGVKGALKIGGLPEPGQNAFIEGMPSGRGLVAERCYEVTFEDCDVSGFFKGVVFTDIEDLIIRNNHVHDNRTTHLGGGGKLLRALIEKNILSRSTPYRYRDDTLGDHSDAISIRSSAKGGAIVGLRILDNLIDQAGGYPTLGITLGDNGRVGFRDVEIRGNTILQAVTQAITFSADVQAVVADNVLLHPGVGKDSPTAVIRGKLVTMTGNTLADVNGQQAAQWPGNTWLKPGPQPASVVEAARKAAFARIGATPAEPAPPATEDPRIADLTAERDEARAERDTADAMVAKLTEAIGRMQGDEAALRFNVGELTKELAAANAKIAVARTALK